MQQRTNLFNQVTVVNWQVVVAGVMATLGFGMMGLLAVVLLFFLGKSYGQGGGQGPGGVFGGLLPSAGGASPNSNAGAAAGVGAGGSPSGAPAPSRQPGHSSAQPQPRQSRPWGSGPATLDSLRGD
jgi:hypothetical protein